MADIYTKESLNRQAYVAGRVRSQNESVVKDADRIHEAIATDRKIAFRYFHYTPSKDDPKTYSKSGERIIVSPYALMWNDGNYYLYAYAGKKFRTYRVDRMEGISHPLLDKREGKDEGDDGRQQLGVHEDSFRFSAHLLYVHSTVAGCGRVICRGVFGGYFTVTFTVMVFVIEA
jgi:predicted DNA-binding transcriptional regulator YafY